MADEEDLYSGYDYDVSLDATEMQSDTGFQEALKTSSGKRPATSARIATAARGRTGVPGTAAARGATAVVREGSTTGSDRPMTAVKGAGYTSGTPQTGMEAAKPLVEKEVPDTPEEKILELETKVMDLVEESCLASCKGDDKEALDKAKEASAKERTLIRFREQAGLIEGHNMELTFMVLTNLAYQYDKNELFTESLNTYTVITKNKSFNNPGRMKVNMGNVYYKIEQYPKALKFYRMALDLVTEDQKSIKIKIMQNIGALFVKMGRYPDAVTSFEYSMHEKPSFRVGLHLIVCFQAMSEKQKQRDAFEKLLQVPCDMEKEEKYKDLEDEAEKDPQTALVLEVIKNDAMRKMERRLRNEAEQCIITASKLISTSGETQAEINEAYDWVVETLKNSQHADLAADLEINKAVMFLRQKDMKAAIDTLKVFDKVETKVASHAFTNLAFLYFLRDEQKEATRYAEQARDADGYNSPALVNLGNCCFQKHEYEKAKEHYICALDNDASCVQALYNLGLTDKHLGLYKEAQGSFMKLHTIVRSHPQIIYQIAHCFELLGDVDQATEWYVQVLSLVPSDPDTLQHLGVVFDREGDKQGAYQYFFDSSRFYPANLEVIDWLGSYYIEHQVSEKAIAFFERATLIQPAEVKWHLMIASCYRRAGNYQRALAKYKEIHMRFPDDVECLKFLVRICTDLGLAEAADYARELQRAEKSKAMRDERNKSAKNATAYRGAGAHGSRSGSAASIDEGYRPASQTSQGGAGGGPGADGAPQAEEEIDAKYKDPLGPMHQRMAKDGKNEDDWEDEIGDDLLPE